MSRNIATFTDSFLTTFSSIRSVISVLYQAMRKTIEKGKERTPTWTFFNYILLINTCPNEPLRKFFFSIYLATLISLMLVFPWCEWHTNVHKVYTLHILFVLKQMTFLLAFILYPSILAWHRFSIQNGILVDLHAM